MYGYVNRFCFPFIYQSYRLLTGYPSRFKAIKSPLIREQIQ